MEGTADTPARSRLARWAPALLALVFGLLSFRTFSSANPGDTDAARHAMNGALVYDFLRSGHVTAPVEFGAQYYGRYPAISLPYHPPLFPAVEALLFVPFGVSLFAARLAVAAAVAASAVLLYRLVLSTHRSPPLALLSATAFLAWHWSQALANDVMLEFPSLALILVALRCLASTKRRYLAFALFAGAAVWTKQLAVFLGAVPFVLLLLSRDWGALRRRALWLSAGLFAALVIALTLLSSQAGWAGVSNATATRELAEIVARNAQYYYATLTTEFGALGAVLLALALLLPYRDRRQAAGNRFYLAWALSAAGLLLVIGHYDQRYLFYLLPPVLVIGIDRLIALSRLLLSRSYALAPAAAVVSLFSAMNLAAEVPQQRGPAQAAEHVVAGGPARIVYCGRGNGAFTFAVRARDQRLASVVLRGDKLDPRTFAPAEFESFAHRFGVKYIVLERTADLRPWSVLVESPAPSMVLERELPLSRSQPATRGTLRVYRFTNPSPQPQHAYTMSIQRIGREFEARF
jgi:4-amino-4-deoxy-L-arabinose transferase-like glycosyltransferase